MLGNKLLNKQPNHGISLKAQNNVKREKLRTIAPLELLKSVEFHCKINATFVDIIDAKAVQQTMTGVSKKHSVLLKTPQKVKKSKKQNLQESLLYEQR